MASKSSVFYGWVIVVVGGIILFLEWGFQYSYGVFLTDLCDDLNWTKATVSGAYSLFMFWHSTMNLLSGRLNDKYGPRLTLAISIIALSAGYALMSIINAPWQLYIFYGIIIGIGAGFGYLPVVSTVTRWFVARRGMALGITVVGIGMGTLVLAPFSQFLIFKFDWRNSYLIIAGIIFIIGFPITRLMKLDPREKRLLPDGAKQIAEKTYSGLPSQVNFTLQQAIKTKGFWLLFAMYAFLTFTIHMVLVHLKAYATVVGISPMSAATILGLVGGASILGRITIGSVSDRIGRKACLFIACLSIAVMMLWLVKARQPGQFYLFSAIFGFGYGSNSPLFPAITADWFGTKSHGIIYGTMLLATGVGGAIGPLLGGYVFDATGSYDMAFIIGAIVSFIAAGCNLVLKKPSAK